MEVATLTTTDDGLLAGVRDTLAGAESAVLCVAFVSMEGVGLLRPELQALGDHARLLVTTTFGTTSAEALNEVLDMGVDVRVLNPGGAHTYHPKLYLGQRGDAVHAVVGSANLTAGLVGNVEIATHLAGQRDDPPIRDAWQWAGELWARPDVKPWERRDVSEEQRTVFEPDLYRRLRARFETSVVRDRVVMTLGRAPKPNRVTRLTTTSLWVETERSRAKGRSAQPVPAWMFNVAWNYLRAHGRLENRRLLNVLHVHRSTAVCAVLAQLPEVRLVARSPVTLAWGAD